MVFIFFLIQNIYFLYNHLLIIYFILDILNSIELKIRLPECKFYTLSASGH